MIKQKKCKQCKELFEPQRSLQYLCSPKCAIDRVAEAREKKFKKEAAKEKKTFYDKNKTLSQHESEARKPFQLWIRKVRDVNYGCISCGTKESIQFDAGHYFSANQFSGLIFDESNVHKQCVFCNKHQHGNLIDYREGLIKRYGEDYVKELEGKKDRLRNYKFSKEQLIEIKTEYQNRLKELK